MALRVDQDGRPGFTKNRVCVGAGADFHVVLHSCASAALDGETQPLVGGGRFFFQQCP